MDRGAQAASAQSALPLMSMNASAQALAPQAKKVHPVQLEWKDLCFTVKEKKGREGLVDKPILQNLTGNARPGSFTVILGASGSGKTSLLSVLADRLLFSKGARLEGEIQFNGEPKPPDYRSRCAFVQQTEIFYPYATVRETVEMASRLRLGAAASREAKAARAEEVIQQLGLSKAKDTKVGNGARVKGISGGEMKRVSIACEIVSSPSLLMLDEPTSGLDSTAALNVVQGLVDLAKCGHTVVASIHQPGSAIYALFGDVIVLAEGQLAFYGDSKKVVDHFSSIGFSCPPLFNPAEYVLQVTSVDCSTAEVEENSRKALAKILEQGAKTVPKRLPPPAVPGLGPAVEMGTSYGEQFQLLFNRIFRDAMRNKVALIIKVVQSLMTTLIMVALYSNLDGGGVVSITVTNIGALLFFVTINGLFGPLFSTIQAFAPEVNIVLRERMNNLYSMAPYYLAKLLVALPVELLPLVIGNTVAFFALKLDHDLSRYLYYLMFTCGMTFCSVALGFLLAAATGGNIQASSAAVGPIALIFLLLGGFFINASTIPVWISWLSKVSYVSWSYQGLAISQFNGRSFASKGVQLQPDGSCPASARSFECQNGVDVLGNLFNNGAPLTEDEWTTEMLHRFGYIVICICVFNFFGYLVLLAKGPKYLELARRVTREAA
eukprot:TRINITY_DN6325_c0_g2_i4.p1 TRINITY_DN6325_c0_g2~~TRINITY_DN6325_c0_g2_i4.p1  ORF type:complete len:663 (-),score=134.85 TRINITY_DN6325_c0_g2_i4:313-2301(-)